MTGPTPTTPNCEDSEPATAAPQACLTIFHDGSCPLCQREIGLVRALDAAKDVAFTDISGLATAEVTPGLSGHDAMQRFHVRRADGTVLSGAAAFIEMWSLAPRLRFLKPLQNRPAALRVLDAVYRGFLVVRPPLSRALGRYDRWHERPARARPLGSPLAGAGSPLGESHAPSKSPVNERFPDRAP